MTHHFFRCLITLLLPLSFVYAKSNKDSHFETKIRPVLHKNCFECHGEKKQKASLRLDHISFIKEGGENGTAINYQDLNNSLLLKAIDKSHTDLQMPPSKSKNKLSQEEIKLLNEWVLSGAYWPVEKSPEVGFVPGKIQAKDRAWWAFQPLKKSDVLNNKSNWAKNEVDLFVEAKLQKNKLTPAKEATKRELIRRLYFDLHGLPPTPTQIKEFVSDKSPNAYEDLVERLLNSSKYGERWAQHWLDVVRFSESDGYRADHFRPAAYEYRDYVVKSFNSDKPYDQFVKEQIAGDEIDPGNRDALNATMYLRHWIYEWNQRDVETQWDIIMSDITETTADTFMGMSVSCAKCHNHKFDPILQKDYYRLQSFFKALLPRENLPVANMQTREKYEDQLNKWKSKTEKIRMQLHEIEYPVLLKHAKGEGFSKFVDNIKEMILKHPDKRSSYEKQIAEMALRQLKIKKEDVSKIPIEQKPLWEKLTAQLKEYEHLKPKPLPKKNFVVSDTCSEAPPTFIPDDDKKENILPGFLHILDPKPAKIAKVNPALNSTGRRTTLANWITKNNNPLTARVMVNRLWQHHFESGIVATPNNFGRLGELPSHPELLDWLAIQLLDNDWKMKKIHKLICLSATYRQSSKVKANDYIARTDPKNSLLWRYPPLRLDAEQVRDSILAVSGKLDHHKVGGKSIKGSDNRRSLYVKKFRNNPDIFLNRFNAPDGFKSNSVRNITNTPLQSLLLFNSDWPKLQAKNMAIKINKIHKTNEDKVTEVFMLAFGRTPTPQEMKDSIEFLSKEEKDKANQSYLTDLCHIIINSNEFIHLH